MNPQERWEISKLHINTFCAEKQQIEVIDHFLTAWFLLVVLEDLNKSLMLDFAILEKLKLLQLMKYH